MRSLVLIATVAVALVPGVAAAAPRGAPGTLRVARDADHAPRAGLFESWTQRFVQPGRDGAVELRAYRLGERLLLDLSAGPGDSEGFEEHLGMERLTATSRTLDTSGPSGGLRVSGGGRRIRLKGRFEGTLRLVGSRRGVTATTWRLGTAPRVAAGQPQPVTLNWSALIATATVRGTLVLPGGRRMRLDGWRASYEHAWGDIAPSDANWSHWDEAIVHGRAGQATIAYGLNRTDAGIDPDVRDARWLGLLATVGPRGTRICRPRVRRTRWQYIHPETIMRWPTRMRLRCGGITLSLRDGPPGFTEYPSYVEVRSHTRAGRRGTGLAIHLGHPGQ
jgi:hypothetical protein